MNITIKDTEGNTLPGASIYESNGTGNYIAGAYGVIADDNGQASIPEGLPFITVSYVGYETQTFTGNSIPAIITMQTDENLLNTVVVTAQAPTTDYLPWIAGGILVLLIIFYLITLKSKP